MAKAPQDDGRELSQIELFELQKPSTEGRSGIDAYLPLADGILIPFELKSTTGRGVTTARDFGADHIEKWRGKHFLISVYKKGGRGLRYTLYGSPNDMAGWLDEKEEYIAPDYLLSKLTPKYLDYSDLFQVVGEKDIYTLEDAKRIQKNQLKKNEYVELMDLDNGYSQKMMLGIMRSRCEYIMKRGATLNNPHVPDSYLSNWAKITQDHAEELRRLVNNYLSLQ